MWTFQVVGNRGTIEINPRETMAKESSIVGVMLGKAGEVRNTSKSHFNASKLAGWACQREVGWPK